MRSLKGEDRAAVAQATVAGVPLVLMMVADGHGGAAAAEKAHERTLPLIVAEAEALGDASAASLKKACNRAFRLLNADVLSSCGNAGSTLSVVAWNASSGELTVAHAGDSAAMLVHGESFEIITSEHRLSVSREERERVLAQGVQLGRAANSEGLPSGPIRAWPSGLAVCRTIGDADCPAASAEPDVRTIVLDLSSATGGAAVIVASDGVWDALSGEKVARYVRDCAAAAEAAERVVAKAYKVRPRDDVSAAAAWLGTPPWAVRSPAGSGGGLSGLIGGLRTRVRGSRTAASASCSSSASPSTSPSTSPRSSPGASPMGTPMGTPLPSLLDLSALDAVAEDFEGFHLGSPASQAPPPSSGPPSCGLSASCSGDERSPATRTAIRVAL